MVSLTGYEAVGLFSTLDDDWRAGTLYCRVFGQRLLREGHVPKRNAIRCFGPTFA